MALPQAVERPARTLSSLPLAAAGVAVFALAGLHRRQYLPAARRLLAAFPAGWPRSCCWA